MVNFWTQRAAELQRATEEQPIQVLLIGKGIVFPYPLHSTFYQLFVGCSLLSTFYSLPTVYRLLTPYFALHNPYFYGQNKSNS
jgi:hypothetical protein